MKNFTFFIVKFIGPFRRMKRLVKKVKIMAANTNEAYNKVSLLYPNWEISMFWYN